jgi:hypothetical protein
VEIGFQGPDPSTDLRGAGMLGLRNLFYYVLHSENSKFTWQVASDAKTWYFFAASGINFTGKIIDLLEEGLFDEYLINYKGGILEFTNILYDYLYTSFNHHWQKNNITDFMKFNTTLELFMNKEKLKLSNHNLLDKFQKENKFY